MVLSICCRSCWAGHTLYFSLAPTPILIVARLINIADGNERVKLAFPRDGQWRQPAVKRVVIATTRAVTELGNRGVPVTSTNARDFVQYLADFEAANLRNLPRSRVSEQMGWQGEGTRLGFLWGRHWSPKTVEFIEGPYQHRKNLMANFYKRAGVRHFGFHAWRHLGASVPERANVPIGSIQRILGHENRATTEIYLHSSGEAERKAMAVCERACQDAGFEESHTQNHTQ